MPPATILVVDDEPDLELLLRQKFRKRIRAGELLFAFAGDGVEALAYLEAEPTVDVVLTDINMPRMDGLTLLDHIGRLDRLLKVVIVSAYGDLANIRTAMNRGAFDFITKPIDFADLEATLDKTIGEVEALKNAAVLRTRLTAIERELDIARRIQRSTLPSQFPAFPDRADFDLYARMLPAREVGGDFYDFFLIDAHRLGFVLGDVSDKGIGAAIFMAVTRTMLRAIALRDVPAHTCVRHANRVLYPESLRHMFVTLVYGILDTRTGRVCYCNAGHNLPFVLRQAGSVEPLARTGGLGLCLVPDFDYQAKDVMLYPGDSLVLYTDGVSEAVDPHREQFSEERLAACLGRLGGVAPEALVGDVFDGVASFADGTPLPDDMTVLALQFRGGGGEKGEVL